MLFSKQLPLGSLIELCRALRHNLGAGLSLRDVFRQQAKRGPLAVRPIADRVSHQLEQGESLKDALESDRDRFPALFLSLAEVGEQTGNLPEVLSELEKYLQLQQRLWRQFWSQITWPIIQLIVAIFVIAGMIYLLAILSPSGEAPFDPLGFGLTGTTGALLWLIYCFGSIAGLIALYLVLTRVLRQGAAIHELLLRLPVIGPAMRALALTRFCLALNLTLETGMSVKSALRLSLRGTGNEAFISRTSVALEAVRHGEDLTEALNRTGVFPEDFMNIIASAEEGGRVTDALRHQASYYEEESVRRMTILTKAAGYLIWICIAAMLIFLIFRIFMVYVGVLSSFT